MLKSLGLSILLFVIMIQPVFNPAALADTATDSYTLTIEGQGICKQPGYTDNQSTRASIPLAIPKKGGPVAGTGTYTIVGTGYTLSGNIVLSGTAENEMLIFSFPDYYHQGKIMTKENVPPIKMKIQAGSEYIQDYPPCNYKMIYRLIAPSETWQVVYDGYQVFWTGTNEQAGGSKVYWRTTVEFTIENGKYKSGSGTNTITKIEPYSFPPGVWDCVTLKGYPKVMYPSFTVPGIKNGNGVQLTLPKRDNEFKTGFTCLMDTDALKAYYKQKGYKTFPSLPGLKKIQNIPEKVGLFPNGFHNITLANYEKQMVNEKFEGYRVKVRKLK